MNLTLKLLGTCIINQQQWELVLSHWEGCLPIESSEDNDIGIDGNGVGTYSSR